MSVTEINQTPPEEPITIPSDRDGVAYLYGHPLLNSLSPPLHQTVYNALGLNWTQIPLSSVSGPSETYPPPLHTSNPKFVGSSVTMPHKVAIMPYLDDLTEHARQAGACNTIFMRDDPTTGQRQYVGTNTDCDGIREALTQNAPDPSRFRGRPALIIGGGGTARTAIYVMRRWLGSSRIYIVNRDAAEVAAILEEDRRRNPDYNAQAPLIPVTDPAEAARLESPRGYRLWLSWVLLPMRTSRRVSSWRCATTPHPGLRLLTWLLPGGWKVILGSEALIWQGLEQARLWTGKDIIGTPGLVQEVKDLVAKTIAERASAKSSL
ncbi:Quinate/shikimate 5-dehydrogenase/glutamyl-tRNA reductase [Penicillium expansum]|nr:Quinate/shikimate 5-dehydrogenase/glutamyl-tRNA reductase [Penicillium expansum]